MLQRVSATLFVVAALGFAWKSWEAGFLARDLAAERAALAQMTEQRDEWQQSAERTERELKSVERQRREAEAAVQALQEELAEQAESYDALRQRIRRAPASEDGPVAPVLRDTLERLP